jgi:hypothetical protein
MGTWPGALKKLDGRSQATLERKLRKLTIIIEVYSVISVFAAI